MLAMKIYSYTVRFDKGFAPNPFWRFCTLATCKPKIRKSADINDWVVGTGGVENVGPNRLIYAMKVCEKIEYQYYWNDRRFIDKRPNLTSSDPYYWVGDNIYRPKSKGGFDQLPSFHGPEKKEKDLKGRYVLVSDQFYYFGNLAPEIPPKTSERPLDLQKLIFHGQGHKIFSLKELTNGFLKWLKETFQIGKHGNPCQFPSKPPNHADRICDC